MKKNILELLRAEDLTEDMQRLAEVVGLDHVKKIIAEFDGERLDIPGKRTIGRLRERYIRTHYRVDPGGGDNRRTIAKEIEVSIRCVERTIQRIQNEQASGAAA